MTTSPLIIVANASLCQEGRESVRKSGRLSESRQHCQRSGDVVMAATTSSHGALDAGGGGVLILNVDFKKAFCRI